MFKAGVLKEDEPIELLAGKLIPMSPIGSKHSNCVKRLNYFFSTNLSEGVIVSVQDPIQLPDHSEPEPDLALIKGSFKQFEERHPLPEEVILIVEVADTTLIKDRDVKLPLYAEAGVGEYWIIDLENQQISVYTQAKSETYGLMKRHLPGDSIHVPALGIEIEVSDILGLA